jgi:nucleoside-diphosphate-sugar epimerase
MTKTYIQDVHAPPRPPDLRRVFVDIQKARELLGYHPQFTTESGIEDLIKHYTK